MNLFKTGICIIVEFYQHLYGLAIQAGFYGDMVEYLILNLVSRVQSPAATEVISIFPSVTFDGQHMGSTAWVSGTKMEMYQNYSMVPSKFRDESI